MVMHFHSVFREQFSEHLCFGAPCLGWALCFLWGQLRPMLLPCFLAFLPPQSARFPPLGSSPQLLCVTLTLLLLSPGLVMTWARRHPSMPSPPQDADLCDTWQVSFTTVRDLLRVLRLRIWVTFGTYHHDFQEFLLSKAKVGTNVGPEE